MEANFREKFEAFNRVRLTDSEFARLLDEIITPDVFTASKTLSSINSFRNVSTPYYAPGSSMKPSSFRIRVGWRIFRRALASIWRMRSRVTWNWRPTSSSVRL